MVKKGWINKDTLPKEWRELVEHAMNSGITKHEFIEFLEKKRKEINDLTKKR